MSFIEQDISKKSLVPLSEGQTIEIPAEPDEMPERPEKIDDLEFQSRTLRKRWTNFVGDIINKNFQSRFIDDDLARFVEKLQWTKKTNHDLDVGGWTNMALDLAFDEKLGQAIDEYRTAGTLEKSVPGEPAGEEREAIISGAIKKDKRSSDPDKQDKIKARVLFLENLLNETSKRFSSEHKDPGSQGNQSKDQKETLISLWSDIFSRFIEMRVQASQGRLKELLPKINEVKQEIIDYLKENYFGIVSPEGLARVKDVRVWLGDEYLECGRDIIRPASYNGETVPPVIYVAGVFSSGKRFRKHLAHELIHASSGHGNPKEFKGEGNNPNRHIIAKRRVGLSDQKKNVWLNEALTEELSSRANNIPEDRLLYPRERLTLNKLLENQLIKEEDLMRWYFIEGDDGAGKERLQALYPDFFPKLATIQNMSKGGIALEKLREEDISALFSNKT